MTLFALNAALKHKFLLNQQKVRKFSVKNALLKEKFNPSQVSCSSQGELDERRRGHKVCDENGENDEFLPFEKPYHGDAHKQF